MRDTYTRGYWTYWMVYLFVCLFVCFYYTSKSAWLKKNCCHYGIHLLLISKSHNEHILIIDFHGLIILKWLKHFWTFCRYGWYGGFEFPRKQCLWYLIRSIVAMVSEDGGSVCWDNREFHFTDCFVIRNDIEIRDNFLLRILLPGLTAWYLYKRNALVQHICTRSMYMTVMITCTRVSVAIVLLAAKL